MKAGLVRGNRLFVLGSKATVVGREPDCDVVLSDESVSRRHAIFIPSEGTYLLVDLDSVNGTRVGDEVVQARLLSPGDLVRLGDVEFRYQGERIERARPAATEDERSAAAGSGLLARVLAGEIDEILLERGDRDDTVRLAILYAVNQLVGSVLRPDELMSQVVNLALKVFRADRSHLLLRDGTGALVPGASLTRTGRTPSGSLLAFSHSIAEACAESGKPIRTDDAAADPRFSEAGSVQMLNIRCAMAAPLQRGETFYGVLYVDNRIQSEGFSEGDLQMLSAFASQVALAIENSRLFGRVEEHMLRLQRQQEVLLHQEKLATLGELAAGVAHEVRSPLTVISSYAEMLLRRKDESSVEDWVGAIMKGCDRISRIVGALLDFARKGRRRREICSLNRLLQETLAMSEHTLSCFRNVEVTKHWATICPSVFVEGHLMQQVFLNLIMNAAQAMEEGGRLSISTGCETEEGQELAVVTFEDTGAGIPADRLEAIFESFVTFKEGGTGLGLAICKRIVEESGGRIEVDSEIGRGTRFRILIPGTSGAEAESKVEREVNPR